MCNDLKIIVGKLDLILWLESLSLKNKKRPMPTTIDFVVHIFRQRLINFKIYKEGIR